MDLAEKKAALESSLERAAETLGDITPHVLEIYYRRCPAAKAEFAHHSFGDSTSLEGQMVEQTLYCLMEWFESPGEIEIVLISTIPHHLDTLRIEPRHFSELIIAVCDTIVATIPPESAQEVVVWDELRTDLLELFESSAYYAQPTRRAG